MCDLRHDADHEAVGEWHVGEDDLGVGFLKAGQELDVAGQAVELCDYEDGIGQLGKIQRLPQLRAIRALTAFDFGELMIRWSADEGMDRLPLCLQAKAGAALT
jgi:hypothetical protein